ncbi:hypothetical protein TrVE_jg11478 [Triparma verrucosa]|uniref:Uncharacterized protein n=1 Tax=Triparma verrucosa TaxID=1606542 RepID=A0A9W7C5Q6_9STRA|nr:hypothetical protein TrVE_jg11478 [Triparma verrucosa]
MATKTAPTTEMTSDPVNQDSEAWDPKFNNGDPDAHFNDEAIKAKLEEELESDLHTSWSEVCIACCTHTRSEWGVIALHLLGVLGSLYFFLFSLDLMGASAKVMTGCGAGTLLGGVNNPMAGLTIGILATVLLQSSSTTTSVIVALVGAGSIEVELAIYMIMGANIGTSVTNTIVAMGQMGDKDQLERAFAAATVHDSFNIMAVIILLPIEAATNYLYYMTKAMLPSELSKGEKWQGPLSAIVSPLTKSMIIANKKVIQNVAITTNYCDNQYPVMCVDDVASYDNCVKCESVLGSSPDSCQTGLITCDEDYGCPAFFTVHATQADDETSGWVCFFLSLLFLVICLICLIKILSNLLLGASQRILRKATDLNGYVAMVLGCGITILVQSSSITTSVLTPLAGLDIISLEVMLPITLGANIGTTVTGLLASMVSGKVEALQVALAHLFFNISGILIFYPIPWMRQWPLRCARALGKATRENKFFPVLYIVFTFFICPLALLGISILWDLGLNEPSPGLLTLAIIITIGCLFLGLYFWYGCTRGTMKHRYNEWGVVRSRRKLAIENLADDMEKIKGELVRLKAGVNDKAEDKNLEVSIVEHSFERV